MAYDVDSFAEVLLTLIRDNTLRQRMGQPSYERIQAYDVHRMADQHAAVYDAIMQSASR